MPVAEACPRLKSQHLHLNEGEKLGDTTAHVSAVVQTIHLDILILWLSGGA